MFGVGRWSRSCSDHIPPGDYSRVTVYSTTSLADAELLPSNTRSALLYAADAFLQTLAERVRAQLRPAGASDDALPRAEPALGDSLHAWRGVGGELPITAYRDGHVTWRVPPEWGEDSSGVALLAHTLAAAQAAGEKFWWPVSDSVTLDSARFAVQLVWPTRNRTGALEMPRIERSAEALFSVLEPSMEPVRVKRMARVEFPDMPKQAGFRGNILMQFVVDTTGRAEPQTVRDLLPRNMPPLMGEKSTAYAEFVAEARRAVLASRFEPAHIGACRVPQLAQLPFHFDYSGR